MRSSRAEGKESDHVITKAQERPHLAFIDTFEEFIELTKNNLVSGSIDASLVLRELYDADMGLISGQSDVEDAFLQVLYRENEDISYYNSLPSIVQEFIALDMHKILGISIKEYLECTPREVEMYVKYCEERVKLQYEQMQELQNETNKTKKKAREAAGSLPMTPGASLAELGIE